MIFLLNFREDILGGPQFKEEKKDFFVNFAQQVKSEIKDPASVVEIILSHKDYLINKLQTNEEKQKMMLRIFKFICEYIIDSDDQEEEINVEFLTNIVLTNLVTEDELKPKQL